MTNLNPDLKTRAYIYRVLGAASPLSTAYGITNEVTAALWLGLAAAVLGLGLAVANTTPPQTRNEDGMTAIEFCIVLTLVGVVALLFGVRL